MIFDQELLTKFCSAPFSAAYSSPYAACAMPSWFQHVLSSGVSAMLSSPPTIFAQVQALALVHGELSRFKNDWVSKVCPRPKKCPDSWINASRNELGAIRMTCWFSLGNAQ